MPFGQKQAKKARFSMNFTAVGHESSILNSKKLRMDHFYDETVAEVSTPAVTPVPSIIEPIEQKVEMAPPPPPPVADNTLDNLLDDEGPVINKFLTLGPGSR